MEEEGLMNALFILSLLLFGSVNGFNKIFYFLSYLVEKTILLCLNIVNTLITSSFFTCAPRSQKRTKGVTITTDFDSPLVYAKSTKLPPPPLRPFFPYYLSNFKIFGIFL